MRSKEYEERLDDLQNQIDELKKVKIEEEKKSRRWKPAVGDIYWYISCAGTVRYHTWDDEDEDKQCYAIGNCFKTEEEAEFEVERLKVIAELKEFEEPEDYKWDGENRHYYLYCNDNELKTQHVWSLHETDRIYFESDEKAKEAVKAIGKDRIKKYYLGVKE